MTHKWCLPTIHYSTKKAERQMQCYLHEINVSNFVRGGGNVTRHFIRGIHNKRRLAPPTRLYQVYNRTIE